MHPTPLGLYSHYLHIFGKRMTKVGENEKEIKIKTENQKQTNPQKQSIQLNTLLSP